MLIWATGNKNIPLVDDLDVSKSTHGLRRILTDKYLKVRRTDGTSMPDAYALGDAADVDGHTLITYHGRGSSPMHWSRTPEDGTALGTASRVTAVMLLG